MRLEQEPLLPACPAWNDRADPPQADGIAELGAVDRTGIISQGGDGPGRTRSSWSLRLCAAVLLNIVVSVSSNSAFYKELYSLEPYPYFTQELNNVSAAAVVGLALVSRYAWRRGASGFDVGVPLRAANGGLTVRVCVSVSLLSTVFNSMQVVAVDGMSSRFSTLTVVLQQAVVPLTVVLSYLSLRIHISRAEALSALTVLAGVAVAFGGKLAVRGAPAGWVLLYFASTPLQAWQGVILQAAMSASTQQQIPNHTASTRAAGHTGASTKEVVPNRDGGKEHHTGWDHYLILVFWLNLIPSVFNVVLALCAKTAGGHSPRQLFDHEYRKGWLCLWGHDAGNYGAMQHGLTTLVGASDVRADCDAALARFLLFLPLSILYVATNIMVVHLAGATAQVLVAAVCLPLQNICLASKAIMGTDVGETDWMDYVGMGLVVVGLSMYARYARSQKN